MSQRKEVPQEKLALCANCENRVWADSTPLWEGGVRVKCHLAGRNVEPQTEAVDGVCRLAHNIQKQTEAKRMQMVPNMTILNWT